MRACVCVCARACCHNTTVFHLQCSLFELMFNAMVMSGFCPPPPPFYGTCAQSSHRCVWCGFEPRSGHVRQTKFCLRVCQVVLFFSGVLPFSSHLLIGASHVFRPNLLPRNSVVTINGLPDMIFTVEHGRKAATQANNQTQTKHFFLYFGDMALAVNR